MESAISQLRLAASRCHRRTLSVYFRAFNHACRDSASVRARKFRNLLADQAKEEERRETLEGLTELASLQAFRRHGVNIFCDLSGIASIEIAEPVGKRLAHFALSKGPALCRGQGCSALVGYCAAWKELKMAAFTTTLSVLISQQQ